MSDKHDYLLELCELHHNNHLFLSFCALCCYVRHGYVLDQCRTTRQSLARDYVLLMSRNSFSAATFNEWVMCVLIIREFSPVIL